METPQDDENNKSNKLTASGWLALAVLAGFFGVSFWYAVKVWSAMAGTHMSGLAGCSWCWAWWSPSAWARA